MADIALWIAQLFDPDPAKRAASAHAIRALALTECFSGVNDWIRDPEFGKLTFSSAVGSAGPVFVVGIAVKPDHFERIRLANGSPRLADVPANQDAVEFELYFAEEGGLDIITTRDGRGAGAIARYLEKFGEGIQQVEIQVSDVDRATRLLATRFGLRAIYPATQAGADQTRVNFFLAPAASGKKYLIELVEPPAKRL
jgi:hypothetical protein